MALYYTPDLGKLIEAGFLSIIALTWEKSYYIRPDQKFWNIWAPNMPGPGLTDFSPTSETFCRQMETIRFKKLGCVFLSTITADLMFIASLDCFWIAFRWQQSRARVRRHGKLT